MALLGIDVSRHQGTIDWRRVASAGHSFAFCKCTDSTSYRYTYYFGQQAPLIRNAGLMLGAYHWLSAHSDPRAQAEYFVRTLREFVGSLDGVLCALDVERGVDGSAPTSAQAHAFAQQFAILTGGHPLIVYTGKWYWVGTIGNPHGADIGPLWHSEYETTDIEVADGPELDDYGGWPGATFWQYTSSGSCPGVAGSVDLNIFYGDRAALDVLAGQQAPPPPVPDLEEAMAQNFEAVLYAPESGVHYYAYHADGLSYAIRITADDASKMGAHEDVRDWTSLSEQAVAGLTQKLNGT